MVDHKRIGFSQGVDLSFLPEEAQQWVQVILEEQVCIISTAQSSKLGKLDIIYVKNFVVAEQDTDNQNKEKSLMILMFPQKFKI